MVYYASLEEQLNTGGIRSKLQLQPIVDKFQHRYYVSKNRILTISAINVVSEI